MNHTRTRLTALVLALIIATLAPASALAQGQQRVQQDGGDYGPLVNHHRAAQLPEAELNGSARGAPMAVYGMITLNHFEVVMNERHLDWKTVKFLEMNLMGSAPEFAYARAPASSG